MRDQKSKVLNIGRCRKPSLYVQNFIHNLYDYSRKRLQKRATQKSEKIAEKRTEQEFLNTNVSGTNDKPIKFSYSAANCGGCNKIYKNFFFFFCKHFAK